MHMQINQRDAYTSTMFLRNLNLCARLLLYEMYVLITAVFYCKPTFFVIRYIPSHKMILYFCKTVLLLL